MLNSAIIGSNYFAENDEGPPRGQNKHVIEETSEKGGRWVLKQTSYRGLRKGGLHDPIEVKNADLPAGAYLSPTLPFSYNFSHPVNQSRVRGVQDAFTDVRWGSGPAIG